MARFTSRRVRLAGSLAAVALLASSSAAVALLASSPATAASPSQAGSAGGAASCSERSATLPVDTTQGPLTDCEILLTVKDTLRGNVGLNWSNGRPLADWEGVTFADGRVTVLDLTAKYTTGTIPPELGDLTELRVLSFSVGGMSGTIPPELGNLTELEGLYLRANKLSGAIPPELGNLTKLKYLFLNNNKLSGAIPAELGNLTGLLELHLNGNDLSGAIPAELGNLTKLMWLALNHNELSGEIPPELGNLPDLLWLYLHDNELSGAIPAELGNFSWLLFLYVNNNRLSGEIPPELGALSNMWAMQVDDTLTGCIPRGIAGKVWLDYGERVPSPLPVCGSAVVGPGPLSGFTLVNAADQSVLASLTDGADVVLADPDGGRYGIRADLASGRTVGSVSLTLTGARTVGPKTENLLPYSLYGDNATGPNSALNGENLPAGSYTLTATAYSQARLGGNQLGTLTISFTVTGTAGRDSGPLAGFTLVGASNQSVLASLSDGARVELSDPDGGSYGIRADLVPGATLGSVSLTLSGAKTVGPRTENLYPYSLYGDHLSNQGRRLYGESLPAGSYTLRAVAYSGAWLGGDRLGTLEVSFTVIDS